MPNSLIISLILWMDTLNEIVMSTHIHSRLNEWLIVIEIVAQVKMFTNDFIKLLYKLFGNDI